MKEVVLGVAAGLEVLLEDEEDEYGEVRFARHHRVFQQAARVGLLLELAVRANRRPFPLPRAS